MTAVFRVPDRNCDIDPKDTNTLASQSPTNFVIITGDPIAQKSSGPALRTVHLARSLSTLGSVRIVSLHESMVDWNGIPVHTVAAYDDRAMQAHERWADAIIFQGSAMALFPSIRKSKKFIVVDAYDPMPFEALVQGASLSSRRWDRQVFDTTFIMNEQLLRADMILCASERQRMLYLGMLLSLGRITPEAYVRNQNLADLIVIAPFGFEDIEPKLSGHPVRDSFPNADQDDFVMVWSGGIYDWFDPVTLIDAVAIAVRSHPKIRLFFMGTKHPNPDVPPMAMVQAAEARASALGILGTHVVFNDGWVPFDERSAYLLDADAGVSTHFTHIETTFSFRTRLLDYLWCRLPLLVTQGDDFADLVEREHLGIVVKEEDSKSLAEAILRLSRDEAFVTQCKENIERVRKSFTWTVALTSAMDQLRNAQKHGFVRTKGFAQPASEFSPLNLLVVIRRFRHDLLAKLRR